MKLLSPTDLIRLGYFNGEQAIYIRIRKRKWPKPMKVAGKLRWRADVINKWIADESIVWIPRRNK